MDVLTAAFHVVHDSEGGSAALAAFLSKARGTLDHEVNPPKGSSAKFGLVDAFKVSKRLEDFRILYAFAEGCDHVCFPAPRASDGAATTEQVLQRAMQLSREFAESFEVMNRTLADGQVRPNELADFEREAQQVIVALAAVSRALRAKMDGDLASHQAAVETVRRRST